VILIIEGSDLVGKSTIAEQCAASHGWPIVKIRWSLIGDVEAETRGMATATIELLVATQPDVIFDRMYFSMWAYGKDVSYMPELIAAFDRVSRVTPARLVLLTASGGASRAVRTATRLLPLTRHHSERECALPLAAAAVAGYAAEFAHRHDRRLARSGGRIGRAIHPSLRISRLPCLQKHLQTHPGQATPFAPSCAAAAVPESVHLLPPRIGIILILAGPNGV
jgi:hypothetical protein